MAINIGPKIGIDGEAQFRKEINNIIQQQKTLESEMKAVTSSFDKNTSSQERAEAQGKVLNQQIQVQEQRVEMLQKGLEAAAKEFGGSADQTLKWEQALNEAKTTLNGMKSGLSNLENGVEDVTEELEDGEKASSGFGDALKAGLLSHAIIDGVKSLAGKISDLTESTKEYRKIMASLEVSSKRAGYSAEETAETYKILYGVLGDDQTAATTTANLQAIGLEQDKLTELTNAAIGAWATYGDSIPIDGLAESVNETIKAGQVTGTFADVLNWASLEGETFGVSLKKNTKANEEWNKAVEAAETAEDYFNLALQEANTSTERANVVLKLLEKQGLAKAGKAWRENNEDIVGANEAASDFQEVASDLAKQFSPISISMQKGFNRIAKAAGKMVSDSDIDEFSEIIEDIADFVADDVIPVIKGAFDFIIDNKGQVLSAVKGIGAGFAAWKSADVVSKVSGYLKGLTDNAGKAAGPMGTLNSLWKANPAAIVATSVGLLTTAVDTLSEGFKNYINSSSPARTEAEKMQETLEKLQEEYDDIWEAAWENANAELSEISHIQGLYGELKTLADETGKVTDKDKDRANFILTELNKALGTEYTMTGNQIKNYQAIQKEIDGLIEKKKAQILLEASEKTYQKTLEQKAEFDRGYQNAYAQYVKQREKVDKEYADMKQVTDEEIMDALANNGDKRIVEYGREKETLRQLEENWRDYKNKVQTNLTNIGIYEEAYTAMMEGDTDKVIQLLERQGGAYTDSSELVGKTAEEQKEYLREKYEDAKNSYEDYREKLLAGAEGYNKEELEILRKGAEQAKREMKQGGANTVDGFISGITSKISALVSATKALTGAVPAITKNVLQIRSPSRVMKKLGGYTGEGFEIGLDESMKGALATLQQDLDTSAAMLSNVRPFSVPMGFGNPAFSSTGGHSATYGDFSIVVNAAPGMDENALANAVAYRLQTQIMQKEAAFR